MRYEKTLPPIDTTKITVEETTVDGGLSSQSFSGVGFCINTSYRKGRVKVCGSIGGDTEAVRYDLGPDESVTKEDIRIEVASWAKNNGYKAQAESA